MERGDFCGLELGTEAFRQFRLAQDSECDYKKETEADAEKLPLLPLLLMNWSPLLQSSRTQMRVPVDMR